MRRAWRARLWHLCWWTRSARPVLFRGPWCFLTSRLPRFTYTVTASKTAQLRKQPACAQVAYDAAADARSSPGKAGRHTKWCSIPLVRRNCDQFRVHHAQAARPGAPMAASEFGAGHCLFSSGLCEGARNKLAILRAQRCAAGGALFAVLRRGRESYSWQAT